MKCDPKDPKNCQQTLAKGQQAGISGVLMSPRKAAKLVTQAEQTQERVDLAKAEAKELLDLTKAAFEERLKSQAEFNAMEKDLLMKQIENLEKLQGPRWYEHPIFVATVSVAATIGVFYGATEIVKATK